MRTSFLSISIVATISLAAWAFAVEGNKPVDASKSKDSSAQKKNDAAQPVAEPVKAGKADKAKAEDLDDDGENDNPDESATSLIPEGAGMQFSPNDSAAASRRQMDALLPRGTSHRGVYYPAFRPTLPDPAVSDPLTGAAAGVNAPMDSLFKSDVVTRLDDDHVQFDRAKWVQFSETPSTDGSPKPKMSLEIERGIYDLKSGILMTNQPVVIENEQFKIEGDSMLHDRASGLTRFGRVKMTFYQSEENVGEKPEIQKSVPTGLSPTAAPTAVTPPK